MLLLKSFVLPGGPSTLKIPRILSGRCMNTFWNHTRFGKFPKLNLEKFTGCGNHAILDKEEKTLIPDKMYAILKLGEVALIYNYTECCCRIIKLSFIQ